MTFALIHLGAVAASLPAESEPEWTPAASLTALFDEREHTEPVAGRISPWGNQSGLADRDLVTVTADSTRPYAGRTINGLEAVDFRNGQTMGSTAPTQAISHFVSASAYHVFAVVDIDAVDTDSGVPSSNDAILYFNGAWGGLQLRSSGVVLGWHLSGTNRVASAPITPGVHLIEWWYDGTDIRIRVDNGPVGSVSAGSIGNVTGSLVLAQASSAYFDGAAGELQLYNAALSSEDQAAARAYLATKWATPSTSLLEALRPLTSWTAAGTPVRTGGEADPLGKSNGVAIEDDDSGIIEGATYTTTYALVSATAYRLVWWVKKDEVTDRFPEFQNTRGADVLHVHLNTQTGETAIRVQSGFTATSFAATEAVTGWWRCEINFTANSAGTLITRVYPAMGVSLGGSTSVALTGSIIHYGEGLYAVP